MGLAAPLSVEAREMPSGRMPSDWHAGPLPRGKHVWEDARVVMRVVMRVEVRGRRADELEEPSVLAFELSRHALGLDAVELEVQPDTQGRARPRQRPRFLARGPVHHQTGARQDAVPVCFDDAAVNPWRDPEVVTCDDEPFHGDLTPRAAGGAPRASARNP